MAIRRCTKARETKTTERDTRESAPAAGGKKKRALLAVLPAAAALALAALLIVSGLQHKAAEAPQEEGENGEAAAAVEAPEGSGDREPGAAEAEEAGPDRDYAEAQALLEAGRYEEALAAFEALDGYGDSADRKREILRSAAWREICPVGGSLLFGSYEQDNDTENGKEDIEWLVLAREENRILVVSKRAVDCQKYNPVRGSVTWEDCSLRAWLNGSFMDEAFSPEEKALIPAVSVPAEENPVYRTEAGGDTRDQVFLLSIGEVNAYFGSDEERSCEMTDYCVARGGYISREGTCWWWLRSPGGSSRYAAGVFSSGAVDHYGDGVFGAHDMVRPAMWIELGPTG